MKKNNKVKRKKPQNFKIEFSNEVFEIPYLENMSKDNTKKQEALKNKYHLQFIISIIVAVIFLIILYYHINNLNKQEAKSQKLLNNYSLTTLYNDDISENVIIGNQSVSFENPFVIGMIRISKINLNYPILSESNSELLKISLCRFAGPMPNEIGNLCVAGHNYVDNKLFSRLAELENNDLIEIYDLNGRKIDYYVTDKYEVKPDDLSCINQNVGKEKIVTLLTCNNVNGKRTVVKAKEVI